MRATRAMRNLIIQFVEYKTRTYHGRVGSGRRTAGRRGGAGSGRTGRRRIGSPRRQPSLAPSKASYRPVLNNSSEARTSEILCKPMEEQKPHLTSTALDQRFIRGTTSALRSWLLTNVPTLTCLCKPSSCKAYPGIITREYTRTERLLKCFAMLSMLAHPKRRQIPTVG